MNENQGSFDRAVSGAVYDLVARLTGYGPAYYGRVAKVLPLRAGMSLLDLGCGTGSLILELAKRMEGRGSIVGIDLSARQLEAARRKQRPPGVDIEFREGSIQELPFPNESIDGICMSQVLHGVPADVVSECLAESARVLVPGGFFCLAEWSRPRLGLTAAIWGPTVVGMRHSHNWQGTWPEVFATVGLELVTDVYLDSLNRYQLFLKSPS